MNRVSKGDYVICVDSQGKKHLLEVTAVEGKTVCGILEKNRAYAPENVELPLSSVAANLGPDPKPGSAYGCNVEIYRGTVESRFWGNIHFFRRFDKKQRELLKDSLSTVASFLKKKKLLAFLPLEIEIRPQRGRYAGMYHKNASRDVMVLRPKDDLIDNKYLTYVVAHESFHGIWYRCVPDALKAKWIKLYHSYLKFSEVTKGDIEKVKSDFFSQPSSLREYMGRFAEDSEELIIFRRCVDWIRDNHSLSVENINTLVYNDPDFLEALWPTYEMLTSDYEVVISDYAMTKVEEFFAEAGAFYFTRTMKLPGKIASAMEKTLAASRWAAAASEMEPAADA